MMDAVKFLVECHNYCEDCRAKAGKEWSTENCSFCDLNHNIFDFNQEGADRMVKIIERLIAEKKGKTRQSKFLKMFPNALTNGNNLLSCCPRTVDWTFKNCCETASTDFCRRCREDYWLTPIDETVNKETD